MLHEIDYAFNKDKLLLELERFKNKSNPYKDPRYPEVKNFKILNMPDLKIAEQETRRFLDFYNIPNNGSGRYYILDNDLPIHTDCNTTCSVNAILNKNKTPITINGIEYEYSTAILNTQLPHGVFNNKTSRLLFKISFFDLHYNDLVKIVSDKKYGI